MTTKKNSLIIGGIALLVVGGAFAIGPLLNDYFGGENTMNHGNHQPANDDGSLVQKDSDDYKTYAALKGDDFDRRYIADMIIHHQGAVEMADIALQKAEREDIRELSREIIRTQSEEITDMERWQQAWGYASESAHQHMNHGSDEGNMNMNMSDHMEMMMKPLREKTGTEFDKEWITQMIIHHQGAINMSAPAEENAKHQEIKDLARDVISAQAKEIEQMRQWQSQ